MNAMNGMNGMNGTNGTNGMNDTNGTLRLYLIRHGETEWSQSGRHTGTTDIALTAQGEDDARALGPALGAVGFTHVFTSPRQRARRTCELVELGSPAQIDPDLAEWDYGEYEGRTSVDIRGSRPDWNVFRDGCPGGETPAQVHLRADRLFARLRALDGNVALFSHGQFSGVLAARWIGLPVVEAEHFPLGTACYAILSDAAHHPEVPVIARWNEAVAAAARPSAGPGEGGVRTSRPTAFERWENEGGALPRASGATRAWARG